MEKEYELRCYYTMRYDYYVVVSGTLENIANYVWENDLEKDLNNSEYNYQLYEIITNKIDLNLVISKVENIIQQYEETLSESTIIL